MKRVQFIVGQFAGTQLSTELMVEQNNKGLVIVRRGLLSFRKVFTAGYPQWFLV